MISPSFSSWRHWSLALIVGALLHSLPLLWFILPSSAAESAGAPAVVLDLALSPVSPDVPATEALLAVPEKVPSTYPEPEPVEPEMIEEMVEPAVEAKMPDPPVLKKKPTVEVKKKTQPKPKPKPAAKPKPKLPEPVEPRDPLAEPAKPAAIQTPVAAPTALMPQSEVAGSPSASKQISNWQQLLMARLYEAKRYPRAARVRGQEGVVELKFSLDRKGRVLHAQIAKSSGFVRLDDEVLALVKRAAPLPVVPAELSGDKITLTVPISFSLR